ncbi:MAG TPA: YegS/Rv2252/BmrU family lipid kinase [Pseudonocardiaceae bacterium]
MRTLLVVNPASGRGAGGRAANAVAATLRSVTDTLDLHVATSAEDTAAMARRAVAEGYAVLAVLGGDGTVMLTLEACAGSDTALAVIPAGTGNDLAAALGLPAAPLAAASAVASGLAAGALRPLDLGRVEGGGLFSTVLCAGFDSKVNERANRMRWPSGPRRYDLAILGELARLRPYPLVVETEDGTRELDATMVSVGNTPSYGGGLRICPGADLGDGLFDITIVGPITRRRLVQVFPRLRTGAHVDEPEVQTFRARSVRVGGTNDWVAYADGDPQGPLPLTVTCVPAAIQVIGPAHVVTP